MTLRLIARLMVCEKRDVDLEFEIAEALGMKPEWNQFYHNGHIAGGMEDHAEWVRPSAKDPNCLINGVWFTKTKKSREAAIKRLEAL